MPTSWSFYLLHGWFLIPLLLCLRAATRNCNRQTNAVYCCPQFMKRWTSCAGSFNPLYRNFLLIILNSRLQIPHTQLLLFCQLISQKIGHLTKSERQQHNEEKHHPVGSIYYNNVSFLLKFAHIQISTLQSC